MKKYLVLVSMLLLLCGVGVASAETIGNDIIDRPTLDGATHIAFIDPTLYFPSAGILDSWSFWVEGNPGDLFATQIYRYTGSGDDWTLVYHQAFEIGTDVDVGESLGISATPGFGIEADDVVGWWFGAGGGTIPFTYTGQDDVEWSNYLSTSYNNPAVGDIVRFDTDEWARSSQKRDYSIAANYTPVPEPATMLLLGVSLFGLAAGVRRKLNKS